MLVRIVIPCLTFSNFRVYSLEKLAKWYTAFIVSAVNLAIGAILGYLGARLLRLRRPYLQILVLSTTFGNVGALPYVLIPPIVANWKRVNTDPDALIKGYGVISLYAIIWGLSLFGLGPYFVKAMRPSRTPAAAQATTTASSADVKPRPLRRQSTTTIALQAAGKRAMNLEPVIIASMTGVVVGLIAPLRRVLSPTEGGPLRFIGSFSLNLGQAGIPLSTVILGASLYLGGQSQLVARRKRLEEEEARRRAAVAEGGGSLPMATPSAVELVEGGGHARQANGGGDGANNHDNGGRSRGGVSPMSRLVVAAVVIKLILLPAISIPLTILSAQHGLLAKDEPMLLMILMLQSAVPSAQTGLALINAAGLPKEASQMSMVYLPMYCVSIVTVAAVIVIAVTAIETLDVDSGLGAAVNVTNVACPS